MSNEDVCVVCGNDDVSIVSTKLRHNKSGEVVRCTVCGLVRLKGAQAYAPRLNDFYSEQYAQQYYSGIKGEMDSLFESFLPVQGHRVEKVASYLKSTDRVLEVGSGPGYFLASIRDRVAEVQGIELNRKEAVYASTVRGIPTSHLPHENSDVQRGYFDHLFLFQVLEHAANPIEFLNGLKSFLRPGGRIHIEVPNLLDPLTSFYDVEPYRDFYYQEPHLYYFTPETLAKVCEMAGFRAEKIFGFQQTSFINHINWLFLRQPQRSRWDCIQSSLPAESLMMDVPVAARCEFDELMKDFNERYRSFLERNKYSDMVFATIQSGIGEEQ
jgi:2-polyprenyl-3-methyl-5-hydroxy-6-metoxy-1,4-benzoquinol methylase